MAGMTTSLDTISLLTLAVAALTLGLSGYYFFAAFDTARPWLPQPMQENVRARFALDRYIWSRMMPTPARWQYLLSHVSACVGLGCLAVLAIMRGPLFGGLMFAAITAFALVDCWLCWRKYRRFSWA
jgi:hypothetical protein